MVDGLSAQESSDYVLRHGYGPKKATALNHFRVGDLAGFRVLDSDIVKDYLIEQALSDGIYDNLQTTTFHDGRTVAPREQLAPATFDAGHVAVLHRNRAGKLETVFE